VSDDEMRALAARYFAENDEPGLRSDGMPDEGIDHLRRHYVDGVMASPEAQRQLREWAEWRPA